MFIPKVEYKYIDAEILNVIQTHKLVCYTSQFTKPIVFKICLLRLRVMCYLLLPKFEKYITKYAFGLLDAISILVDIAP